VRRSRVLAFALLAACGGGVGTSSDPAGPFAVGVAQRTFVDETRPTAANGDVPAQDSRTLRTRIWYPAAGAQQRNAGGELIEVADAPPARTEGPFPLIVFAHGFQAVVEVYRQLYVAWAERGYVVAAANFPLSSSGNEGPPVFLDYVSQPGDISFLIDSMIAVSADRSDFFGGLVDAERIGAAGQSLGGFTTMGVAFHTCCADPRIDAAAPMAASLAEFPGGEYFTGIERPILVIHGDEDETVPYEAGREIFARANRPKYLVTILGGDHIVPYVASPREPLTEPVRLSSLAFFDRYLRGRRSAFQELLAVDDLLQARVEAEP